MISKSASSRPEYKNWQELEAKMLRTTPEDAKKRITIFAR